MGNLKPLLKWVGGKRWLLPVLEQIWQPYTDTKLVEPFTGGMAVALGLNPKTALLNDVNEHLINFYNQVRNGLQINNSLLNNSDFYYETRNKFNSLIYKNKHKTKAAATMFYYLIRTGFNGLCRFNNDGGFNVPFGQHSNINYNMDFSEYQKLFKSWDLMHGDFSAINLNDTEFIYADPPYDVEFTRYSTQDFKWHDQIRLAAWLSQHSGPIVASNQATTRIIELYKDLKFKVFLLPAPRMISCNGDRTPAIEILAVRNIKREVISKLNCAFNKI